MQQASQATNETRLPRAVARHIQALDARFKRNVGAVEENAPESVQPTGSEQTDPSHDAASAAPTKPVVAPDENRQQDAAYWQRRTATALGYLEKERNERAVEVDGLHQRINELQAENRTLRESQPEAKIDAGKYLTPEQIEEFGSDQAEAIVTAAERIARERVQASIDEHIKPMREQREREQQRAQQNATSAFEAKLDEAFPRWREVDPTDDWRAWLAQEDPATEVIRQDILDKHVQRGNAAAIAKMFQTFEDASKPPAPPVAPHGGAGVGDHTPAQPDANAMRPPSPAEVKDFYKRSALGKVKDQERVAFEARLKLRAG